MRIGYIYKLTNKINGNFYIGKTSNIKKRMSAHKCDRQCNTHLSRAIDKYGFNNFILEIIWSGNIDLLNEKEIYYVESS